MRVHTSALRFSCGSIFWLAMVSGISGCSAPSATLDLLTVARKGLAMAKKTQAEQHAEVIQRINAQVSSLDSGFDADVRLIAAGQIKDPDGHPVQMSAEWVISARKGYVTARDILLEQVRLQESANAVCEDNLVAADEALEMASQLIVQQYSISEKLRQHLIQLQRSLVNGQ